MVAPAWAEDGSFLVFRRLKQNVGAFHKFLHDEALKLEITPGLFGAKCVGRWASGAPILRAREIDNVKWAEDDSKNNDFMFTEDLLGQVCPVAAHIRKVYPRGDVKESEVQRHRLLRRGIPYGDPSLSSPTAPVPDTENDATADCSSSPTRLRSRINSSFCRNKRINLISERRRP